MKISAIPTFTSSYREVNDYTKPECFDEHVVHRNTTYFFRNDINWESLFDYLLEKYEDTDKVHTYCYACSDGSEPYSIVMKILSRFKNDQKKADKYMPVIAKDYDSFIINKAKTNLVMLLNYEPNIIEKQTKENLNEYMEYLGEKSTTYAKEYTYKVKPTLTDRVEFSQADMMYDIDNIESDNSIIFCRNFWPYMKDTDKINNLAKQLYERLGKNSCVLLGSFDESDSRVFQAMKSAGFELKDYDLRLFEKTTRPQLNVFV